MGVHGSFRGTTYRFESELPPVIRLRLKIEINTREHLCLLPIQQTAFSVDSRWFTGEATLPIYATTEAFDWIQANLISRLP